MATLTSEVIEKMDKNELRAAAKTRGIKYGKMSLLQIREALKTQPEEIDVAAKKKTTKKVPVKKAKKESDGSPSKMDLAVEIMEKNKALPRKDMLKLFQDKAGLTKAGSATYYTLVRKKLGIK